LPYFIYIRKNEGYAEVTIDPNTIFDTESEAIQQLIMERNWKKLTPKNRIIRILDFVKNEVPFGFTPKPRISASYVLMERKGQALTKSILLKTLLDACDVLCRFHAFHIKKEIYRGLLRRAPYRFLSDILPSCWIEVFSEDQWLVADGVLLDEAYLNGLKDRIAAAGDEFLGLGAGIFVPGNSHQKWDGKNHTYCQRAAIVRDFGVIEDFEWYFTEFQAGIKQLNRIPHKYANRMISSRRMSD